MSGVIPTDIRLGEEPGDDLSRSTSAEERLPPRRIDVLTSISGVQFEDAWGGRATHEVAGMSGPFLGRDALLRNKRAAGRTKDLADLEALGEKP
ncbi:MAG TPA: hypothetical protein VLF95_03465 [Vicinamibacteria bacterium]|nr:hypothetical protein [Vicinamibacteria bacterium]